jgi:hypothetical protein
MTGDRDAPDTDTLDTGDSGTATGGGTHRARIETTHDDHETARLLARALRPDNTAEMDTRVEGCRLVTTVERETTGGLQSTADDYVVNLQTGTDVLPGGPTADSPGQERTRNTDSHGDTTSRDTSDADTGDADTSDADTGDADTSDTTRTTETDNE